MTLQNITVQIKKIIYKNRESDYYFAPFFRVLIGLFCLLHFLSIVTDFQLLYGQHGFVPSEVGELFKDWGILGFSDFTHLMHAWFRMDELQAILLFKCLFILFAVFLTCGFVTRISAIILLVLHICLAKGSYLYAYGVDSFTAIALFYCVIFPLNRQYSIDKLIFRVKPVSISKYRKLLQVHLCFVYFSSGFEKACGINWWNGEAVWKSLTMPILGNHTMNFDFLAAYPILPTVMGWGTIIIELCYPFFIFRKKTSQYWLSLTVLMHLGIFLFMDLYFFGALMIILNLSAFLNLSKANEVQLNPAI